jgi:LysM repeat protein
VPTVAPSLLLPATQPGASRDEGTFLVTATDNDGYLAYFIAGNARHSVLASDMQRELQRNPLWPVRSVSADEVLAYPEGAPVGSARPGLLDAMGPAPVADLPATTGPAADVPPAAVPVAPAPVAAAAVAAVPVAADSSSADSGASDAVALTPWQATDQPAAAPAPVVATAPAAAAVATPPRVVSETPLVAEAPVAQELAAPAADASQPTTYVLRSGDNLTRLAAQYGTSIDAILAANGISNANKIYVGKTLVIPTADAPTQPALAADQPPAPVAEVPTASDATGSRYTVRPGDSATSIARQFGVDVDVLLATNGITNRNRVYIGQTLTIPS